MRITAFLALFLAGLPAYADDNLQEFLSQTGSSLEGHALDAGELNAFYSLRGYKPAWDTSPQGNRAALTAFVASIADFADYHGLATSSYPTTEMTKLIAANDEKDTLKLEVLITSWLLRLAHDMRGDRVNLAHLYPNWPFHRDSLDVAASLERAAQENRVSDFIASLAPSSPAYARLTQELKNYRELAQKGAWPHVAPGATLRPGDHDGRVPQLRARLEAEGYLSSASSPASESNRFDSALEEALIRYQTRNGLKPDGHVGSLTFEALNVPLTGRLDQILANLERWRHMPDSFPARYAVVNIADFSVKVIETDKPVYQGLVIVGRPDRKTPFMQSALRSMIFNPAWHVPVKIARKDILPKLRKDPNYLEKQGIVISGNSDDPHGALIDWHQVRESAFDFELRQAPGDLNSLGRLKFDFDNDFSVYMHGTPHQELFDKPVRTLSSGCVRLHDPDTFALLLLARNSGNWTLEKIQAEIDKGKTRWLHFAEPLPLYFVYWTVFADAPDAPLNFRDDVYDYDRFLMENLRNTTL
ncbi:MAG: L,D-transpeptidase family protein [Alphaproteobacteria bacterium]|nr:L,D-transpeptidase family protein [Alphaproteobacteria bacterium]